MKKLKYFNGEKENLFKKTVLEQVDKHFGRETNCDPQCTPYTKKLTEVFTHHTHTYTHKVTLWGDECADKLDCMKTDIQINGTDKPTHWWSIDFYQRSKENENGRAIFN